MMAEQPDPGVWRRMVRGRLLVVGAVFAVWVALVVVRLVTLQVYQHEELKRKAERQQQRMLSVPARRGEVLDRNGRLLAYTVDADSISAVPSQMKEPDQVAARLCQALEDCGPAEAASLAERLRRQAGVPYVRRHVSQEQARRVMALKIDGVIMAKEPLRFYPNRELAAHVLGYVGAEGKGLAGIEATYESKLRGRPGRMLVQQASKGKVFDRVGDPPVAGATLELTIDQYLQHIAERELRAGVQENHAASGSVVVMNPATGEILAIASEPTFNPNDFGRASDDRQRNRAVQDLYEPGSTFKIVTASAALEEKVFAPGDAIETGNGTITVGPRTVTDTAAHGTISFADVIALSSNVGAIKIGFQVGAERLGRCVERFGFGTRLSPDFRSENAGMVTNPSQWTVSTLMSVSIGYEIGVTPLQMAAAASAIANGGELVQPRVLRAVVDGEARIVVPRKVIRRVMTGETAAELTSMLEGVVQHGTATTAQLQDVTAAGKTGTTKKLVGKRYSKTEFTASFVGFVPSRQPALTILVVIDSPHGHGYYGGAVAAPIFKRIAEASLRHLGLAPAINPVQPVLVARHDALHVTPVAAPALPVTVVPAPGPSPAGPVLLPELRGLSGREALRVLGRLGIFAHVAGAGVVTEQEPPPGAPVEPGAFCRLVLGRPAVAGANQ